jgi:hypothetical protein
MSNKKGNPPSENGVAESFTTARLYTSDAKALKELADSANVNVAEMFRDLGFSEVLRQKQIEKARKSLKDLENQRP